MDKKITKIRFRYIRDAVGNPLACIAYTLKEKVLSYGLAVQNPKDNFNAKLAREIASGRLIKRTQVLALELDYTPDHLDNATLRQLLISLRESDKLSTRMNKHINFILTVYDCGSPTLISATG